MLPIGIVHLQETYMKLNTMQIQVAQIFEGGIYDPARILEDTQIQDDALFLFLLQEAEICSDTEEMKERITTAMDRLQDLLEALEPSANAAAENGEGDYPQG